ncbi:MAG: hypothetical protein JSS28_07200 [Proteobacteria bacterium]|nr:hypothetical protein [Pseudomonadota bacterium]
MPTPNNEMLLALRSPKSGWLATLICALEEALKDVDFSEHHRAMVRQLLEQGAVSAAVSEAAEARLTRFEQNIAESQVAMAAAVAAPIMAAATTARPKLALVSNAA